MTEQTSRQAHESVTCLGEEWSTTPCSCSIGRDHEATPVNGLYRLVEASDAWSEALDARRQSSVFEREIEFPF